MKERGRKIFKLGGGRLWDKGEEGKEMEWGGSEGK